MDWDLRNVVGDTVVAAAGAGVLIALQVAGGLQLVDGIDAGGQIGEFVVAVGVGRGGADHRAALVEKLDRDTGDRLLPFIVVIGAVAGGILVDVPFDTGRQEFTEVVVDAVVAPQQRDTADLIAWILSRADDLTQDRAGGVFAIEPAAGLDFANQVRAGREILKL